MQVSFKKLNHLVAILTSFFALQANASVLQTVGSGSAVTSIDATADFTNPASLYDNPYIENGLSFSRTNLTFNNNGCGYDPSCFEDTVNFNGNFMWGQGYGGYFTIQAEQGKFFHGLEFVMAAGFADHEIVNFYWEAFSGNSLVGSGRGNVAEGTIVGFKDLMGFDTLRWTETLEWYQGPANFTTTYNAPAFDTVRAQYGPASARVPEPATVGLLGLGLLGFAASSRKSGKSHQA